MVDAGHPTNGAVALVNDNDDDSIFIPLLSKSDEFVEVKLSKLPENVEDVQNLFRGEIAPLRFWLRVAIAYLKQGKVEHFKAIMEEAVSEEIENVFREPEHNQDRAQVLSSYAAFLTTQARTEEDKSKQADLFDRAARLYNRAEKLDKKHDITAAGKGFLQLAQRDVGRALKNFELVETPATQLGMGACRLAQHKPDEALAVYRRLLEQNPEAPAAVRLGLAHAFFRTGRIELARAAFERVQQLDAANVEALLGLAVCELNTAAGSRSAEQRIDSLRQANLHIVAAYVLQPTHARVLNLLADRLAHGHEWDRAAELASQALRHSEASQIRAESLSVLGRVHQARRDYDQAYTAFAQAVDLWPDHALALFGLAQMCVHRNEPAKAITVLERVLVQQPDNVEAMHMLGSLYSTTSGSGSNEKIPDRKTGKSSSAADADEQRRQKALQHLKRVCELAPRDPEAFVELAQLLENHDPLEALQQYERAQKLLESRQQPTPPELWNNIGALRHHNNMYVEAQQAYPRALGLEKEGQQIDTKNSNPTTVFNLARLFEDQHEDQIADSLYRQLKKDHPHYIDSYLRLCAMARARRHFSAAVEHLKDAFEIDDKNTDAWAMFGQLHLDQEEWNVAQKKFERILTEIDKTDPFSQLALGNIYYQAKFEKKEKEERYLKLALDFYWKVLHTDPKNVYAANGVALVLAERGNLMLAREMFGQVRELAEMGDVCVNLAHIYLQQNQRPQAIKLYETALQRFSGNKDTSVLLYLARAYLESNKLDECKRALQRALHLRPSSSTLWFNLAIAQEYAAYLVLNSERPTVVQVAAAQRELAGAQRLFSDLAQVGGRGHSAAKAAEHRQRCDRLRSKAEAAAATADQRETDLTARRLQQQQLATQLADARRREAEMKLQVEQAAVEEQQRLAKAHLDQLEQKKLLWMQEEQRYRERQTTKGKGGGRRAAATYEGSDVSSEDGGPNVAMPDRDYDPNRDKARPGEEWKAMRDKRNPLAQKLAQKLRQEKEAELQKERDQLRAIGAENAAFDAAAAQPSVDVSAASPATRSTRRRTRGGLTELYGPEELAALPETGPNPEEDEDASEPSVEESEPEPDDDENRKEKRLSKKKHKKEKEKREKKKKEKKHKKNPPAAEAEQTVMMETVGTSEIGIATQPTASEDTVA